MVVPPDEAAVRAARDLADYVKGLAQRAAEAEGSRDAARWLAERTSASKDSWNRRFNHKYLIDYADLVEVATAFGMAPADLVRDASEPVGGAQQDVARVTPITRKRASEMTTEELEQERRRAATQDASEPREFPEG